MQLKRLGGATVIHVDDRTFPSLIEHVMGGQVSHSSSGKE